jgi:hypothetical protein
MAQERDKMWALVNTVADLPIPEKAKNSWLAERILASQNKFHVTDLTIYGP